jgi:putative phosphoesterase
MLLGIMSDTHNDLIGINKAVDFFNLRNVDLVLHCGDFSFYEYATPFRKLNCGFRAVYGNNDFQRKELDNVISAFGRIDQEPAIFKLDGKNFYMSHRPMPFGLSPEGTNFDYVLYGHTHVANIQSSLKITIINPGEACGQRTGKKTVAILDTQTSQAQIIQL